GRDDVGSVSPIWNCRYVARAWMRRGKGAGEGERGGDGKERRKERMRAHGNGKAQCFERVVTKRACSASQPGASPSSFLRHVAKRLLRAGRKEGHPSRFRERIGRGSEAPST